MKFIEFASWSIPALPLGARTVRTLGIVLAMTLALGACDAYGVSGGGGSAGGENLTLSVATPVDGAEVSIPFDVTFESNVDLGSPETGNHHVHLFVDTDTASSEYEIVYGSTSRVTAGLAPGEHTLIASLRNADHSDAGESQTIRIVVSGDVNPEGTPVPVATPIGLGY